MRDDVNVVMDKVFCMSASIPESINIRVEPWSYMRIDFGSGRLMKVQFQL